MKCVVAYGNSLTQLWDSQRTGGIETNHQDDLPHYRMSTDDVDVMEKQSLTTNSAFPASQMLCMFKPWAGKICNIDY
jgi:hypothetical protein